MYLNKIKTPTHNLCTIPPVSPITPKLVSLHSTTVFDMIVHKIWHQKREHPECAINLAAMLIRCNVETIAILKKEQQQKKQVQQQQPQNQICSQLHKCTFTYC